MERKDELKEIDIKNRTCYHFDDIITNRDIYSVDILLHEKIDDNFSVYDISYKSLMGPKPLEIRFDKIDEFIRILDGKTKHLVLFDYGLFNKICVKKVVLQTVLIIILERSELILIVLYLFKKY